ncbi:hypothetical protein NQ317_012974 [Molorchus minor]|uniref:Uncharacterized protein n=1 Tax=Molorchus minor TaxID=1323400 RepID=A0ABQ9JH33_9CUCU|nr:hypothetical protein NQ317_012974 [Molorchus minor]
MQKNDVAIHCSSLLEYLSDGLDLFLVGVANLDTKFGTNPTLALLSRWHELKRVERERQKTCSILFPMGRRPCERNCHVISYNIT